MAVTAGEYKLTIQRGGKGWYAWVCLESEPMEGSGLKTEGFDPEEATSRLDREWWLGAKTGLAYAFGHLSNSQGLRVRILSIHGMPYDTTGPRVAFAAAQALWRSVGFSPSDGLRAQTAEEFGIPQP
jgi:hypothetical protein